MHFFIITLLLTTILAIPSPDTRKLHIRSGRSPRAGASVELQPIGPGRGRSSSGSSSRSPSPARSSGSSGPSTSGGQRSGGERGSPTRDSSRSPARQRPSGEVRPLLRTGLTGTQPNANPPAAGTRRQGSGASTQTNPPARPSMSRSIFPTLSPGQTTALNCAGGAGMCMVSASVPLLAAAPVSFAHSVGASLGIVGATTTGCAIGASICMGDRSRSPDRPR